MAVRFYNDGTSYRLYGKRAIASWVVDAITEEGFTPGDISYIFCSSCVHLEINSQYLGHDYNTDVITFDYSDLGRKIIAGDIFIDPATVKSNALLYSGTARLEMLRVIIHGILHLCGYKDKTPAQQKQMRTKEDYYLSKFQE